MLQVNAKETEAIFNKNLGNDAGMCRHYAMLWSFIIGLETKNMFEFGSGFSTLTSLCALNLTGGKLKSIDVRKNSEHNEFQTNFAKATVMKYGSSWEFYHGNSLTEFSKIKHDYYDLVLHDGTHTGEEVTQDLNNILPHVKNGGFILVHDTNHPELGEDMENGVFASNFKGEFICLPWGYGMTLIKVKQISNPSVELTWRKK